MNTINEQELKSCLLKEGYVEANGLEATISRLLNMKEEPTQMLFDWMRDGKIPEFDAINGIDSHVLRTSLRMKEPAIIMSYNMLLLDPQRNSELLKNMLTRRKIYHPIN